jgi:hypothetical protein
MTGWAGTRYDWLRNPTKTEPKDRVESRPRRLQLRATECDYELVGEHREKLGERWSEFLGR